MLVCFFFFGMAGRCGAAGAGADSARSRRSGASRPFSLAGSSAGAGAGLGAKWCDAAKGPAARAFAATLRRFGAGLAGSAPTHSAATSAFRRELSFARLGRCSRRFGALRDGLGFFASGALASGASAGGGAASSTDDGAWLGAFDATSSASAGSTSSRGGGRGMSSGQPRLASSSTSTRRCSDASVPCFVTPRTKHRSWRASHQGAARLQTETRPKPSAWSVSLAVSARPSASGGTA